MSDDGDFVSRMARSDFETALRKGYWRNILSWLTQSTNELLPFDEVRRRLPVTGQHYLGLKQIPVDNIVGSVGRYQDFDRAFLPRQTNTRDRWISIDKAHMQDVILPPIEVYKIGAVYFVKDGNHRVSVARERGQAFLDAYVIEVATNIPVENISNIDDLIRAQEYAEFITATKLTDLRPDSAVNLSLPGQYTKLVDHISVHRWYLGEQFQRDIPWEEAVTRWYDEVYLPLVEIIREQKILAEFPGRTEADLYLYIIEHLAYLREEWKEEVSIEEAASHFAEEYSQRPLRRLFNIIRSAARTVADGFI
ncbi:MAG TPA: hypothetical protein VIO36_02040 [Anaerolineaceae bacterium]